jgi:FkbM family methyltransferase
MRSTIKLALHEKVLTQLFDSKKELTFFDIGACEGLSSVRYLSIFPKSIMYTFEPVPDNFLEIKKNIEKYHLTNLIPFELGLSSENGEATFYVSSGKPPNKDVPQDNSTNFGNKSSSLYKPGKTKEVHPWLEFNKSITIKTITLDNFCKEQKIKNIDFIHMDVQGAELMVLTGAPKMISSIQSVWLEVEKIALYENQPLKNDIEDFFIKNNFICILNKMNHIAGDQLWVQKDYYDKLDKNTKFNLTFFTAKTAIKSQFSSAFGNAKQKVKTLFK